MARSIEAINFILPGISSLKTGGNIYNHQLIEALAGLGISISLNSTTPGKYNATLVDSLELENFSSFDLECCCLLLHYHQVIDNTITPGRQEVTRFTRLVSRYEKLIVTSRFVKTRLINLAIPAEKVVVIEPGLAPAYFSPQPLSYRDRPKNSFVTVASLTEQKGYHCLLKCLEKLESPFTWHIVGSQKLQPGFAGQFLESVAKSRVADQVYFHGILEQDEIISIFDSCRFFLSGSKYESSGMAVREAMARSLPVLAFSAGALPCLLPAGQADIPYADTEGLVKKLEYWLSNDEIPARLSRVNRQLGQNSASWNKNAEKLLNFLVTCN